MKIVMCYTDGDGCTYSCEVALPLEHESTEAALVEFERLFNDACENAKQRFDGDQFTFCGTEFYCSTFMSGGDVFLPDFFTLDEWFGIHRMN